MNQSIEGRATSGNGYEKTIQQGIEKGLWELMNVIHHVEPQSFDPESTYSIPREFHPTLSKLRVLFGNNHVNLEQEGITPGEAQATMLYFGLTDGRQRSLERVGEEMGCNSSDAKDALFSMIAKLSMGNREQPIVLPR